MHFPPRHLPTMLVLLLSATSLAQDGTKPAAAAYKLEELEALAAPIALYPDPLLAQVLMASTYPLEVVEAARWSKANPKVTGKDLEEAMLKQTWDPSVKSLTSFPDTLAMMNEKLTWTQKLGDAFLAQQDDLMEAIQRLRAKAQAAGNLKSSKELTVTTEKPAPPPADAGVAIAPAAAQQVIVIQPASPQIVYVPQYNPVVVYGTWPYPAYPPYPVYPPSYVATTAAISFGIGLAVGAAMWGGCSWGYHGYSSVHINVNNYNRYNHTNINVNNNNWNHNVSHRQGVPYSNPSTQQRYGQNKATNTASREQFRGRADEGRQQISQGGADSFRPPGGAGGGASPGQRPAGGGGMPSQQPAGGGGMSGQRPAGGGGMPSQQPAGGGGMSAQRPAGGGGMPSQQPAQRPAGGSQSGANRAGGSAYQGMNNGGQAKAASARGNASMSGGGRGGGGGRRR